MHCFKLNLYSEVFIAIALFQNMIFYQNECFFNFYNSDKVFPGIYYYINFNNSLVKNLTRFAHSFNVHFSKTNHYAIVLLFNLLFCNNSNFSEDVIKLFFLLLQILLKNKLLCHCLIMDNKITFLLNNVCVIKHSHERTKLLEYLNENASPLRIVYHQETHPSEKDEIR